MLDVVCGRPNPIRNVNCDLFIGHVGVVALWNGNKSRSGTYSVIRKCWECCKKIFVFVWNDTRFIKSQFMGRYA